MPLKTLILLTLLSKEPYSKDTETWQQREDRMEIVASAIIEATDNATCYGKEEEPCEVLWPGSREELAFLLVATAHHESNFAQHIHEGACRTEQGECDASRMQEFPGGPVKHYARSLSIWQIQKFDIPPQDWDKIRAGVQGTSAAAWHAARRLSSGYRACKSLEGAISRYATGKSCEWKGAAGRVKTLRAMMTSSEDSLQATVEKQRARKEAVTLPKPEES